MADTKKAPIRRQCGTMQVHYGLLEANPGFRSKQASLEMATQRMRSMAAFKLTKRTVPVVVHVVYNTAAENISDAQIKQGEFGNGQQHIKESVAATLGTFA